MIPLPADKVGKGIYVGKLSSPRSYCFYVIIIPGGGYYDFGRLETIRQKDSRDSRPVRDSRSEASQAHEEWSAEQGISLHNLMEQYMAWKWRK